MSATIFLTGATGNIGGNLVPRILQENPEARMILLVRGTSVTAARRRVENALATLAPEFDFAENSQRIKVICGDITRTHLGLTDTEWHTLAGEITHLIHSAASTKFDLPLARAREINVGGTKYVMALAWEAHQRGNLQRAAYISTAFMCGDSGRIIQEKEITSKPEFSNTYEQSKWEAEKLVRSLLSELPLIIFRPSVVVGDSRTGRTTAFNVLYTPLRFIHHGMLTSLPCAPDTPLDVVPVDYVSEAIGHIMFTSRPCVGRTFNIVVGAKAPTVSEIVNGAVDYYNRIGVREHLSYIRFFPPRLLRLAGAFLPVKVKRMLDLVRMYEPYICTCREFDDTNTREALQGTGITAPGFAEYLPQLLDFCLATSWGKRLRAAA